MFKDLEANPWLSDLGKGSNKKLVEFLTKVGGWGLKWTDFTLIIFFFWKKNMSLKHWMLSQDYLGHTFLAAMSSSRSDVVTQCVRSFVPFFLGAKAPLQIATVSGQKVELAN